MKKIEVGDLVRHNTFGLGNVVEITQDRITAKFAAVPRTFQYPDALNNGLLTFHQSGGAIEAVQRIPIVFLNVAWMKYYRGVTEDDVPVNGGAYIDAHQDGAEAYNYLPEAYKLTEDSPVRYGMFGYYATKSTGGRYQNQMRIENIVGCESATMEEAVHGVLVVWCATPPEGASHVVGWYRNATVLRDYDYLDDERTEHPFNVYCDMADAVLLPVGERRKPSWQIARSRRIGASFGFGQANVWYAAEKNAEHYVKMMIKNIREYRGMNWVRRP